MKKIVLVLLLAGCLPYLSLKAQPSESLTPLDIFVGKLEAMGFENILIRTIDREVYLSYENRVYRSDNEALARIIILGMESLPEVDRLHLAVQKQKIPVLRVVFDYYLFRKSLSEYQQSTSDTTFAFFSKASWNKALTVDMRVSKVVSFLTGLSYRNPSLWRTELVLEPRVGTQLGDTRQPFRFELSVLPTVSVNLWKGAHLVPQFFLQLIDYHYFNANDYFQPRYISFHQQVKLHDGVFAKLSAGFFHRNRYGFHGELRSFTPDGQLQLFGNIAYTGQANYLPAGYTGFTGKEYDEPTVEYARLQYWNYAAGVEWRVPSTSLAFQYSYGKYLYGLEAHKVLIYRNFMEYILGLQAYLGAEGRNFGFYVNIPLMPSKYSVNKKFRLKPSRYINYSYLATRDYFENFTTGHEFSADILELNVQVCRSQLPDYLFSIYFKPEL